MRGKVARRLRTQARLERPDAPRKHYRALKRAHRRGLLAAILVLGAIWVPGARADTPVYPVSTSPYAGWIGTAAGFVPQPHDLSPGVHNHVVGSPCGSTVWGCTDGWGEIWICGCRINAGAYEWNQTFQHEVAHNVEAQEMLAGHKQHFADLVGHCCFNREAWADVYSACARGAGWPGNYGVTYSEYLAVCDWLDRADWGVRY